MLKNDAIHIRDPFVINGGQLSEGEQIGDNVEVTLGAGAYKIVYPFPA